MVNVLINGFAKKKLNLGIDSSTILDTYRHILEPNDIDIEFYGGRDMASRILPHSKLIIDCLQLVPSSCIMIKNHESIKDRNSGRLLKI